MVDRALEWAARVERGERQRDILRGLQASRRPSRGYVSVVVRFGAALRPLPSLELQYYRAPCVDIRLVQRLVSGWSDPRDVRFHLRRAVEEAGAEGATLSRARRGRRRGGGSPPPLFARDDAWADRDPVGYVTAFTATLEAARRSVSEAVRHAAGRRGAPPLLLAGQSLGALTRSALEHREAVRTGRVTAGRVPPAFQEAIALLRELEAALGAVVPRASGVVVERGDG